MEVGTSKIYDELPQVVKQRSSAMIGLAKVNKSHDGAKQQLRDFLKKHIPSSDHDEIDEEIRRGFLLKEKKARIRPRKSLNKKRENWAAPHRGRKRLSGKERRSLGLNAVSRENKTFEMFIPINDMWKKYAGQLLNIDHFRSAGWRGENRHPHTECIQGKIRKLDYFGCFIRITKSRCSEYIGLTGIVIGETKNTFSFIEAVNDRVVMVPKLHSEFSFVIDNVGFTILGNHLHQRPVDRSRHSFKKLHLWL